MTSPLFEQYKAALRRGHLAVLGGDLAAAAEAYREAARLVPDRPLPHASLGTVLYRQGRTGDGEAAFDAALRLAPDEVATLAARATARREVGLAADAAADHDRLAQLLDAAGRRDAALEHARAAMALAQNAERAAIVERLAASPPLAPDAGAEAGAGAGADAAAEPEGAPEASATDQDPDTLLAAAAEQLDAGEVAAARDAMLAAMAVHRGAGRSDAALDVGFQLLTIVPGDPAVHLAIAGLQLDRGWHDLASDKVGLLLRLAELTGDTQATADAHALAAERLRDGLAGAAASR